MKKVLKVVEMPKELEEHLLILNQELIVKQIIDYLIDKLTASRKEVAQSWELAKDYVKKDWPEYNDMDTTLIIDWSNATIKVVEL